jgi:hypothetical protein
MIGRLRMTTARWMVLIAVFGGSLGGLVAYHRWVTGMFAKVMEQARIKAGLPADTNMNDFNIQVEPGLLIWLNLDHFLLRFWFVILPLLLLLAFGCAMLLPARKSGSGPSSFGEPRNERTESGRK